MKMAGSMHPPFRRGEIRFAPQPPDGDGCAALLCPSSPHKIFDFCGAPSFAKRENAPCTVEERKRGRAGSTSGFTNVFCPQRNTNGGFGGRCKDCPALPAAANLAVGERIAPV